MALLTDVAFLLADADVRRDESFVVVFGWPLLRVVGAIVGQLDGTLGQGGLSIKVWYTATLRFGLQGLKVALYESA